MCTVVSATPSAKAASLVPVGPASIPSPRARYIATVGPTSRLLAPGQSARKTVGRIRFRECSVGGGLRAARRRRRSIEDAGPDPSLIGIY